MDGRLARPLKLAALGVAALLLMCLFWRQALLALKMVLGGSVLAFLLEPLCARVEARLSRPAAAGVSLAIAFLAVTGALFLLIPPLIGQIGELAERAPELMRSASRALEGVNRWLKPNRFRRCRNPASTPPRSTKPRAARWEARSAWPDRWRGALRLRS